MKLTEAVESINCIIRELSLMRSETARKEVEALRSVLAALESHKKALETIRVESSIWGGNLDAIKIAREELKKWEE